MVEVVKMKSPHFEKNEETEMDSSAPSLRALAELVGIECDYIDGRGQWHQGTDDALRSTLEALDLRVQSEAALQKTWERIQQERWTNILEPVILHYPEAGMPLSFSVSLPLGENSLATLLLECRIKDEQGKNRTHAIYGPSCIPEEETVIQGIRFVRLQVNIPGRFPLGYFELILNVKIGAQILEAQSLIIVAPQRCYSPKSSKREWGIGVQLYGIRSRDNWGIGDFRDLERIIKRAGKTWKASCIGLPPLHSLTSGLRSPYSPSSRLCWNPLYLALEQVAEFRLSPKIQRMFKSKTFQTKLQSLRGSRLVDYDGVEKLKLSVLEDLFRVFRRKHLQFRTARGRAFLRFVEQSPDFLTRFCTFEVLREYFQGAIWRQWPLEYHDPQSSAVKKFQEQHADRILYFYYVQWLCELQLSRLDQVGQKAALGLGLYQDLPIGIHPDGADAWGYQDQLARDVTIGAPPDSFNLKGQNWGLLAANPRKLREHGYAFLRHTLRQNMRHGGVLRIDHALGLFRMFWIPFGGSGQEGLYVKTYVEEMLAVLALESVRNKVLIVGEDLGTVTPVIRERLEKAGLLSYRLLFFERDHEGVFHGPDQFPAQALVAVTTHDLPTLKGYWVGRDIETKDHANLYPLPEDRVRDIRTRALDRQQLWRAIHHIGFDVPDSMPSMLSFEEMTKIYQFLARTPSRLLMVQLEDLLGELDTPNLPGASDSSYPSWRLRLGRELREWLKDPANLGFSQNVLGERRRRNRSVTIRSTK